MENTPQKKQTLDSLRQIASRGNDDNSHHRVLYTTQKEVVDGITGETRTKETVMVRKEKTRDEFVMLYVKNLGSFYHLDKMAQNLFFIILGHLNYRNMFYFDTSFRNLILSNKVMSRSSIYNAFKALLEEKFFIKVNKEDDILKDMNDNLLWSDELYMANPNVVSKGPWADIKKLRQTWTLNYDFDTLEFTKEIAQEAKYAGFEEVASDMESHTVKQISQGVSDDGKIKELDILVGEKEHVSRDKNDIIDINDVQRSKISKESSLFDSNEKELGLGARTLLGLMKKG